MTNDLIEDIMLCKNRGEMVNVASEEATCGGGYVMRKVILLCPCRVKAYH